MRLRRNALIADLFVRYEFITTEILPYVFWGFFRYRTFRIRHALDRITYLDRSTIFYWS